MLDSVWEAVLASCDHLEQQAGVEVQYAQSTYLCTQAGDVQTRRTSDFSVDATLTDGVRTVWVEAQWTEHVDLKKAVPTATGKLEKYEDAAAEEQKREGTWRLDAALGGGALKPPDAFATLVLGERGFRLDFHTPRSKAVCVEFGAEASGQPHASRRNKAKAAATQKRCRQQALRTRNRSRFQQSPVPVLARGSQQAVAERRVLKKLAQCSMAEL